MFTGIVQKSGQVTLREDAQKGGFKVVVRTGFDTDRLALGESVAVDGTCLTVADIGPRPDDAHFFISAETMARTQLGTLRVDSSVNLERAMTVGDRLSGHIVQGHVDGLGKFLSAAADGECHLLEFEIPASLARYCVQKGSIAINGVSLTINGLRDRDDGSSQVSITLIPHTWQMTNLSKLKPSDPVNIEVDILAKYIEAGMRATPALKERLCPTL